MSIFFPCIWTMSAALVASAQDGFFNWQHMTRTVAHYERLEQIGEGTYGQVYRARCLDTNRTVALKKMRITHEDYRGMPLQFIREIKILKGLSHPNILDLIEVVTSKGVEVLDDDDPISKQTEGNRSKIADPRQGYKGNLFLVLEYVNHDLAGLLDVGYQFSPVQAKCIFQQLLKALAFMHEKRYVHRDIKSSNILLDPYYRLKLADFGLARSLESGILDAPPLNDLTDKVITLWYRPPEILTGATEYGTSVDDWSAGCILGELLLGKPLFAGDTQMEQFRLTVELLGTPSEEIWERLRTHKLVRKGEISLDINRPKPSKLVSKYAKRLSNHTHALGLIEKLLMWDANRRWSSKLALTHRYFIAQPVAPENPAELGQLEVGEHGQFHEFQTKKRRKKAKKEAEERKKEVIDNGGSEQEAKEEYKRVYDERMLEAKEQGLDASDSTLDPAERERRHKLFNQVMEKYSRKLQGQKEHGDHKRRRDSMDSSGHHKTEGSKKKKKRKKGKDRRKRGDGGTYDGSSERRDKEEDKADPRDGHGRYRDEHRHSGRDRREDGGRHDSMRREEGRREDHSRHGRDRGRDGHWDNGDRERGRRETNREDLRRRGDGPPPFRPPPHDGEGHRHDDRRGDRRRRDGPPDVGHYGPPRNDPPFEGDRNGARGDDRGRGRRRDMEEPHYRDGGRYRDVEGLPHRGMRPQDRSGARGPPPDEKFLEDDRYRRDVPPDHGPPRHGRYGPADRPDGGRRGDHHRPDEDRHHRRREDDRYQHRRREDENRHGRRDRDHRR